MSFRRTISFAVCLALSCASLAWGASPSLRRGLPPGLASPFPPPTPVALSNGFNLDSSGNLKVVLGGIRAVVLPNGFSFDASGNLLVNCSGCGTGSGTVNSGNINHLAFYAGNGTAVSNNSNLTESGTLLTYAGTNGITAAIFSTSGAGSGALNLGAGNGTEATAGASSTGFGAPASVPTPYLVILPSAVPPSGSNLVSVSGTVDGSGNYPSSYVAPSSVSAGNGVPLKTSDFSGADGCAVLLAATTQSVTNGLAQDVLGNNLTGDQGCAANPINSSFSGNLRFFNGVRFHLSTSSSSWVLPSKTTIYGSGEGSSSSTTLGLFLEACSAADIGQPYCPTQAFPANTPMVCFISCSTSANVQGFDAQIWWTSANCNYIAGCTAFFNYYAQENSGLSFVYALNWGNNGRGLWLGKTTNGAGSFYPKNSFYHNIVVGLNNAGNGTPICQEGAVGIYVNGASAGAEFPKIFSDITMSGNQCATIKTNNSWTAAPFNYDHIELSGSKAYFTGTHLEFYGLTGFNVGGLRTGYGAYFTPTLSGGDITATTQVSGGQSYVTPTVNVYPTTCTGGTLTPVVSGGVITSLTKSGTFSGCTAPVEISIADSVTTGFANAGNITSVYSCCQSSGVGSQDVIRFTTGATIKSFDIFDVQNSGANASTNTINDQAHTVIPGSTCTTEAHYELDDAGNVSADSCHLNPSVNNSDIVAPVDVPHGGTGVITCAANSILTGNGTGPLTCPTTIAQSGGKITKYGNLSTAGNGVGSIPAVSGAVTIGSGSNVASTSLCSTTQCPAGRYMVKLYIEISTACTTTGTTIPWLGWTDDAGAKTGSSTTTYFAAGGGLGVTAATATTGLILVPDSTTDFLTADFFLTTTGAATNAQGSINYGITNTTCATGGPMVGKAYFDVMRLE